VERSDFILILAPGCYHSDRKVSTCFRTWRRRGWCLLELFASFVARDSTNPPLVVRSAKGNPMWMSPIEIHKLSIGYAEFSCCQRNHIITTETQKVMSKEKNTKTIPCDRPIVRRVINQLIDAKINHLFNIGDDMMTARMYVCLRKWWLRGLLKNGWFVKKEEEDVQNLKGFKTLLRWEQFEQFKGRSGVSLLFYAVMSNNLNVVREVLEELKVRVLLLLLLLLVLHTYTRQVQFKDSPKQLNRFLSSRIRDEGFVALGAFFFYF